MQMQYYFTGAGRPEAVQKLTTLGEPENTSLRKSTSSGQTPSETVSVSMHQPVYSNLSLTASKDPLTDTAAPEIPTNALRNSLISWPALRKRVASSSKFISILLNI